MNKLQDLKTICRLCMMEVDATSVDCCRPMQSQLRFYIEKLYDVQISERDGVSTRVCQSCCNMVINTTMQHIKVKEIQVQFQVVKKQQQDSVRMQTSGGVKRRLPSPLFFEQPARKRMRTDNDDTRIPQMPLDGQVIVVFDHDKLFDLDMSDEQTPKTINEIGTTQKGPPSAAIKTSTNVSYRRLRYNECMGILNALNDKQQYAYHMIEIKESMNDCQILSTAAAATAATKTVAVSAFGGSKIENTNNNRPIQKPTKPAVVNNTNNLNENNLLQTMSRSDRSFLKSTGKSFSDLKASKSMQSTNTQRESAASIFRKELLNQTFFMNSLDCSPIAKRLIRAKGVINLAQDPLPMIPSLAKPQAILHKVAVTELVDNNNNQIGQTKNQNNKIAKAIDELIKMMAKLKLLVAPRVNARPPVAVQKAQQIEIKRKISDDTMQTFQCKSSENKIPSNFGRTVSRSCYGGVNRRMKPIKAK